MERRLLLAVVLSIIVLVSWSALMPKPQHVATQSVTASTAPALTNEQAVVSQEVPSVAAEPSLSLPPTPEVEIPLKVEKLDLIFFEQQAAVKEAIFKEFKDYKFSLRNGFSVDGSKLFAQGAVTQKSIAFSYGGKELRLSKKFIFPKPNYGMELELTIENISGAPLKLELPLILGIMDFRPKTIDTSYLSATIATKEKVFHENGRKEISTDRIKFVALRDRYFCAIVQPEDVNATAYIRKLNNQESEVGLALKDLTVVPGLPVVLKFNIYLGPQKLQTINSVNPEWASVINYGAFDLFAQLILQALEFFHRLVNNWGRAIILLSLLVFVVCFPLTAKQMRSMKEMQILQPKVEEIRLKYKDNPHKMNQEVMALYKEHKVNPLGGCLPMLLQMPILFALYQVLMRSVSLRGAKFLWINDLSMPDKLIVLPQSLPVIGNEINLLPILMTIGMFIQQKLTTVSSSSSSAEQQKVMMIVMPLMFLVFFYHLPSGLVLYWVVNSLLMLIFQLKVSKRV